MNSNNKLKRKKKTHGPGNPSKRHRDRLNAELDNLARLLPFPEETVTKLDKISILRLTVSYLRAKSFFQVNGKNGQEETCEDLVREFEGNGLFSQLSLEALDGFIVVITQEGQLFYVSENVRDFLGYSQAAVIHQSMFKFLHIDDQDMVKLKLAWPNNVSKDTKIEKETPRRRDSTANRLENGKTELSEMETLNRSFTCRMKCTLNHGGGFYKLFRLCGRLREIQTRKRDNDVVEYGLFAICSPAYNSNTGSPASSVKKEVALTAHKRLERTNSDPLGNRRSAYPSHGMMRPAHVGPFLYPNSRPPFSPLGSPTTSSDSGHPSPVSGTIKPALSDQEMQSDISELSNSSKSSFEAESRAQDRMYAAANQTRIHSMIRNEQNTNAASFETAQNNHDASPTRKRSRSLADASEIQPSEYEAFRKSHPFGFGSANYLPSIAEVKNENKAETANGALNTSSDDQRAKAEGLLRRPLGIYDNRIDAARGLMNLGSMNLPMQSMYPFPEFMYPDVMFPRFDGMSNPLDATHTRNPFDVHNPCCVTRDQYSQLAMRRWLNTSDMMRAQMNPLLAAQSAMMSPVERMRLFQMQFPFGFPYPGHTPFEVPTGISERHLAELRQNHSRVVSENSVPHTNSFNEIPVESKEGEEKRSSPNASQTSVKAVKEKINVVKLEKEENGETNSCNRENSAEHQESFRHEAGASDRSDRLPDQHDEAKSNDDSSVSKEDDNSASQFRISFRGIQAEFTNRLENLDRSFSESFGGLGKKDK